MKYLRNVWFSPRKILARYSAKEKELGIDVLKSSRYKTINEAKSVAIMLLGIRKIEDREYWLQLVDPKEQTPDIRTATHRIDLHNFPLEYQDVEVVTLEEHSNESVEDFLKRTKLSSSKVYQEETVILCVIDKDMQTGSWKEISESLCKVKSNVIVYFMGRIDPVEQKYRLACMYPRYQTDITYDALEEGLKDANDTMNFQRGTKRRIDQRPDEKFEPFED